MIDILITTITIFSISNVVIIKSERYINFYRLNILINNYKNGYGISLGEAYPY